LSKVVSINPGVPIKDVRHTDPNVVEILENALEEAKAGELTGVAIAKVYFDMQTHQSRSGIMTYAMIGRLHMLIEGVAEDLRNA